jgi:uncharacterized protein
MTSSQRAASVNEMRWAVLCVAACATEPGIPAGVTPVVDSAVEDVADSGPAAGSIRISAFNVRRLFDERCDSGACGRDDFEAVLTAAQVESRTSTIAERLLSLRADAMCLEEVETQQLLDKVASKMPGHVTHVLGEIGQVASVDVGLISTFPLITTKGHRSRVLLRPDGSVTNFTRELLEVHLDVRGKKAIVFCAHFRSKSSDDPGRRWAEARGAREILTETAAANPGALVVLGGDLNDTPGSEPLNELELEGAVSRTSAGMPDDQIATYWFEGRGSAIDHLYVTSVARYQPATFRVARDDGRAFAGSDHAAVVADFVGF